jgi:protein gp37/ParB-like chromosome segregation protein Spo0J
MSRLGPYRVHPAAELMPLLEGEEFDALVKDVKANGLLDPIVLTHDERTLVDGRNRYRACEVAVVEPVFRKLPATFDEEALLAYVVSANLRRRHLNVGQRARLGARLEPLFAAALDRNKGGRPRKDDQKPETDLSQVSRRPQSRQLAAQVVGVGEVSVQKAKKVEEVAPGLDAQVASGTMSLDAAYRQVRKREKARAKEQPPVEKEKPSPEVVKLYTPKGERVDYRKPKGKSQFNRTPGEGISWASWSWNPVTGCLHGCRYCYARELATRESFKNVYPLGFEPLFHPERLEAPANTPVPADPDPHLRRVFVCSMADLYGEWVPIEWIEQVHAACIASPQWQFILLTKFPSRYLRVELPPSAWVGTSVDEQKRVRIAEDAFREIEGVAVKWLSLEPLLAPLEFSDLSMFDWVVIGAQTETRQPDGIVPAVAPKLKWVNDLVEQAHEVGCRVHCKPNLLGAIGPQSPGMELPNEFPE